MKVEIKEEGKQEEVKYPCLKIAYDGEIIFFINPKEGIVMNGGRIGQYNNLWLEKIFTPFKGSITLSND